MRESGAERGEGEGELCRSGLKTVLRQDAGTHGPGPESLDGVVGVQVDPPIGGKAGLVPGGGQLLIAPAAYGEIEQRITLDTHSRPAGRGQLCPPDLGAVAVLLRSDIPACVRRASRLSCWSRQSPSRVEQSTNAIHARISVGASHRVEVIPPTMTEMFDWSSVSPCTETPLLTWNGLPLQGRHGCCGGRRRVRGGRPC